MNDLDAEHSLKILALVTGQLHDNAPFYAYLSIPADKYLGFVKAQMEGEYNLEDFGDVLEYEKGIKEPSEEVKKEIEERYSADHQREEDVIELLSKLNEGSAS